MSEEQDPPRSESPPIVDYQGPATSVPRWKSVWTAPTVQEAHMVAMKLQSLGLHARVDGENMAPLGGIGGPSNLVAARVHVFDDEVATARQVISEIEEKRKARRDALTVHCAECDVPAQSTLHPLRRVGVALTALGILCCAVAATLRIDELAVGFFLIPVGTALLIWSVTPRWICPQCGKRWAEREPEEDDLDDEDDDDDDE